MRPKALLIVLATILFALAPAANAATKIDDPEKFVRDVYEHFAKGSKNYTEPDDIYTPRLSALLALDSKEAGGEVGRLDFDFFTNSQDWEISAVHVSSQPVENAPSRRIVRATFKNLGTAEDIRFYFEKTKDGWKLDDARSAGKEAWTLSLIAKYGWDDEK
jgi:hypothetical protein